MSGASIPHNRITRNGIVGISNKLNGKNCEVFGSDLRIHIPSNSLYTYPDISIIYGEIEKAETDFDTVTNPVVIIEVLSASTKKYAKIAKFDLYREIVSLKQYILIDCEKIMVDKYTKQDDKSWNIAIHNSINDELVIESIGVTVSLCDIYSGVF